jgi:hypothetical protein
LTPATPCSLRSSRRSYSAPAGRRRPDLADATIKAYARTLARELDRLLRLKPTNAEGRHLRDAIIVDAQDKLVVFLTRRDVVPNNNESERALRPSVIHRKVTKVKALSVGLDGTRVLAVEGGYKQAMAGTISLLNQDGDRLHTIYVGSAPESGKKTFLWKMRKELSAVVKEFPKATVVGVADGARDNWEFLNEFTDRHRSSTLSRCRIRK